MSLRKRVEEDFQVSTELHHSHVDRKPCSTEHSMNFFRSIKRLYQYIKNDLRALTRYFQSHLESFKQSLISRECSRDAVPTLNIHERRRIRYTVRIHEGTIHRVLPEFELKCGRAVLLRSYSSKDAGCVRMKWSHDPRTVLLTFPEV